MLKFRNVTQPELVMFTKQISNDRVTLCHSVLLQTITITVVISPSIITILTVIPYHFYHPRGITAALSPFPGYYRIPHYRVIP